MRPFKNFTARALMFVALAASLPAASITISDSGTFSAGTSTSTFSAANETWAFSFTVDLNPASFGILPTDYFSAPFTGFAYSLNGSSVAITPFQIEFFSAGDQGGLNICMTSGCTTGLYFQGPQMYTGSESAPTMLSGSFTSTSSLVNTGPGYVTQPNTTIQAVGDAPEPSTFAMLFAGLLLLAAGVRYSTLRCRIIPVSVATHM